MIRRGLISIAGILCGLAVSAPAQTVTVAKSGTPNFGTVQAAINSFTPDPNPSVDNVIQITDSSVYDEALTVNVPCTIEGTGATRPVLAIQPSANQVSGDTGGTDGLVILVPTGDPNVITLRKLLCIPSRTSTPADDLIRSAGQNLDLRIEDCVIAPNNGSDAPVSTTGLTAVDLTTATRIGDDGMFVGATAAPAGAGTQCTLLRTVVTHCQNASTNDGLVCSAAGRAYTIQEGCVFSYCARLGIQANGDFTINAPTNRVLVLGNLGFAGIWFAGINVAATQRVLNGVNVLNNGSSPTSGWGIEQQNGGGVPFTLQNAILAGNSVEGLRIGDVGISAAIILDHVTVANNAVSPVSVNALATSTITVTDSVIAGAAPAGTLTIAHDGTGMMTVQNSALVQSGTFALATPPNTGTGPFTVVSSITADPLFTETANYQSADFFDTHNSPYATAGTGGASLGGGAQYVAAGVEDWNLFL